MNQPYDAILFVSFGGPEGMDDVMPFLSNVLRGRNVPESRMREVAHHYELFGGVSPINEQNRRLISALERELKERGPRLPVYWGNRNWHPLLADTLRRMRDDGIKNALAFVTSAYSSYSGCRQYREDIERAREAVGEGAPRVEKLRAFYNHPGFVGPNIENLRAAVGFTSDHMEVLYDLDTEARQVSEEIGLNMVRAATVGTHPQFVSMIRELIIERLDPAAPRRPLGP